jgi:plastocyanin
MRALTLFALLPATALTAILDVDVGEDGFVFNPDTLTAAVGDSVVFHFYPGAHSVAQSSFDSPCQPLSGGIWSGTFSPNNGEDSNVFEVPIANTDPMWIYCAQVGHCNGGMVMVINPP